jgi:hypothetical protein
VLFQVQIGPHVFTFDHVYGSSGPSSSLIFEQCVHPLIDALFSGYNATVLAYGQVQFFCVMKFVLLEDCLDDYFVTEVVFL